MEGPRSPAESEFPQVINFLNSSLREGAEWSISNEYPTALTSNNIHNIRIITDEERIVSHAVLKPLIVKSPHVIFKVGAIGSVVTDPSHRNQGLSTTILNSCLKEAAQQQCDVAVLWTNLYDFYRRLGFELAGTEMSFTFEAPLNVPAGDLRFSDENRVSPEAIHRLYSTHTVGSVRGAEDIRKFMGIPKTLVYTAWEKDGSLAAYAIEGKGADLGGYIHEWAGGTSKVLALLSWIQSRRQGPLTLISPRHCRNMVTQLTGKGAMVNEGFLGMIKILNFDQLTAKLKRAFRAEGVADIVFERTAGGVLFGVGSELFTLQEEGDVCRLIFGPLDIQELDMFSEAARARLAKVLPLPLWLWGWDSV
ncbi:MAG: GNAT family N-acetyltransferase [Bdellovibrionaceae bacterium]|nr:GNAT family N-acetyltransferase [Pseudobdellovibrionaceae bacterium]MBX3032817.1 GNAT family N-acetyltransferase [Pseudobdellovibrionaceae bacterium]